MYLFHGKHSSLRPISKLYSSSVYGDLCALSAFAGLVMTSLHEMHNPVVELIFDCFPANPSSVAQARQISVCPTHYIYDKGWIEGSYRPKDIENIGGPKKVH
jgi:hypothetical protein